MALRKGIESKAEQDAYIRSVVQSAWNNAKVAVKRASGERFIAANIGPMPEYLFLEYDCNPTEEYQFIIECFLDCGAKIFNFETFSDITEVQKAARYIKKKCPEAFVMVSFAVNRTGYTAGGISMNRLFTEAAKTPEIDSYGCNCMIGAAHMYDLLKPRICQMKSSFRFCQTVVIRKSFVAILLSQKARHTMQKKCRKSLNLG